MNTRPNGPKRLVISRRTDGNVLLECGHVTRGSYANGAPAMHRKSRSCPECPPSKRAGYWRARKRAERAKQLPKSQ